MLPHPQATGFDLANALVCARASAAAYNVDRDHESVLTGCRWIQDAATGTQLLIAADDTAVVVAFAGTQPRDFQDWLTDLKFRRVTTDYRYVVCQRECIAIFFSSCRVRLRLGG